MVRPGKGREFFWGWFFPLGVQCSRKVKVWLRRQSEPLSSIKHHFGPQLNFVHPSIHPPTGQTDRCPESQRLRRCLSFARDAGPPSSQATCLLGKPDRERNSDKMGVRRGVAITSGGEKGSGRLSRTNNFDIDEPLLRPSVFPTACAPLARTGIRVPADP